MRSCATAYAACARSACAMSGWAARRRLRASNSAWRSCASSPMAIHTDGGQRAALRAAAGVLRRLPRAASEVFGAAITRAAETLDQAEEAMLELYGERAELADGQDILELGCGWGSLTLWMAERFPTARIVAVSNSHRQRAIHRGTMPATRPAQRAGADRDVNRLDWPPRNSIAACRSRCSSTCAITRRCWAASRAGCGRRASYSCTSSRTEP